MFDGQTLFYMAPIHNAATIAIFGVFSFNNVKANAWLSSLSRTIAERSVNSIRHNLMVDGKSLHDYVPLYWATHTPMQYVVTQKSRRLNQDELVFFMFSAFQVLQIGGVLTTDGNAAHRETNFYTGWAGFLQLDQKVMRERNCYSPEYKRKKAAEVLVPEHIPAAMITSISVNSESTLATLHDSISSTAQELGQPLPNARIEVRPDFYYD